MPTLESQIDELYQRPLGEFVAARDALARTLDRPAAATVRRLVKPTLVPWAVNQVYWRARDVYNRLVEAGAELRRAQVAALEGRRADVRAATEAHRRAITAAVQQAQAIAGSSGAHPPADALARTLEALSLAPSPAPPGRLTQPLQPAGFEALAGVTPHARLSPPVSGAATTEIKNRPVARPDRHVDPSSPRVDRKAAHEAERAAAARRREDERRAREASAKIDAAGRAVARARAAETAARTRWEAARRDLETAERALADARRSTTR